MSLLNKSSDSVIVGASLIALTSTIIYYYCECKYYINDNLFKNELEGYQIFKMQELIRLKFDCKNDEI